MRVTSGVQQTDSVGGSWFGELSATRRLRAKLEGSTALRYALAPVGIAVAVLLHLSVIGPFLHPTGLFLSCIVAAAWFGGAGPGFLAALLATFVLPQLIAMSYPLVAGFFDLPRFLAFGITGVAVGWATTFRKRAEAALRRSELELRKARDELEMKVVEQTAELRRSEALLAEAQKLSQTGSFGWKLSTGEILWSAETFRIFEYDRTMKPTVEFILQRVHPEDAAMVQQTIERASQEPKDFDFNYRLLMPGGSVKYVHVVAHALSDQSGSIEFVGAVMDVTEQHQARAALEKAFGEITNSQDRLRLIIDTIPGMVWSALPDGSVDFVSQPWVEYHGLSLKDLRRQGWEVVIHRDDVARARETGLAAMAAGNPFELELRSRRADGEYRWFLHRAVPLRDEMGNIVKWYGTTTDIEDRKRGEILLAGEKRLLEMIARGDSCSVILDALCRLVEELARGSLSSILLLDANVRCLRHGAAPSLPVAYTEAIDGAIIGPSVGSCGTAAYRAEPVIVSDIATDPLWDDYRDLALAHGLRACWSTPILSSEGRVLGTFAIYHREPRSPTPQDHNVIEQITHLGSIAIEREQAEEALRQAQAELAHVTRVATLGELTASIAHETNQPLGAMVNNASACLRWLAANNMEEARRSAQLIRADGHRAGEIIQRIRSFAKKTPPQKDWIDINQTIREVIALARSELQRHNVSLETELSGDVPLVFADRIQLQQVILNLIMNAVEAMSEISDGPRELMIRTGIDASGGIVVAMQDSGPGLSPEDLGRLFTPFYTTKPQGMGMGLAICRSIIEAHSGRLWATPNDGQGATFQFTLPIAGEKEAPSIV